MARTKKTASTAAEKTVKAVAETVKNETVTAEPVKEEAAKVKAAKAEAPKKTAAAKKPAAKPAKKAVNANVYVQFNNSEAHTSELIAKAVSDAGVESPDTVDVYVRPEINKVYYVIDGNKFGDFELF